MLIEMSTQHWDKTYSEEEQALAVTALESGRILFFPTLPFSLLPEEKNFLSPDLVKPNAKNISFHPKTGLQGAHCVGENHAKLSAMLHRFALASHQMISALFPAYTNFLKVGRTSFRPVEIAGRITSCRKDDTRLHVDAFPATPNQGLRI